jgi:uncharacterized protein
VTLSEGEALALHRKYGSSEKVIRHCQTVATVAGILAEEMTKRGTAVDTRAVAVGALLHDIGRARVQTVSHGLEGSRMVESEGVERKVVDIVRKHVGAGISADEAKTLGMPDLDYIPRTEEERLVCFADKMVDSDQVRPFEKEVERFIAKKHDVPRLLALERGIRQELGEDPSRFVLDKVKESA